jgi:neutral ceramidase
MNLRFSRKQRAASLLVGVFVGLFGELASAGTGWKAGTARQAITPQDSVWMAGYGARTKSSEGAVHDLWAKALALEDPSGRRVVLVTLDICGIDRALSDRIRNAIEARHGLGRGAVVLACSHTHCGPVVGANLITMYPLDDDQRRRIGAYTEFVESTVINLAGQALSRLEDTQLAWGIGRCDFAVNRRNNPERQVPDLRARMALAGPVDHDVPVLRAKRPDGSLAAVVVGYACHCTVLDFYKFCGDYAGIMQLELEARHPRVQAMFVAGCGGDQNPIPRRTLDLAVRYGKELAASVDRVLAGAMPAIAGPIKTSYEEVPLSFGTLPSRAEIERDAQSKTFAVASRARRLLEILSARGSLDLTYPYPVEVWSLGELDWVFLGGEVVVDYSLRIKRNLGGSHTWVSAYCNDVMAYIPSLRVLNEGGYEGATAMVYYGLPTAWSDRVEETVIGAVARRIHAVSQSRRASPGVDQVQSR